MRLFSCSGFDFNLLVQVGILDSNSGNGFSNTTELADYIISPSKTPKLVKVKEYIYSVSYVSGCFFPIWKKVIDDVADDVKVIEWELESKNTSYGK